MIDLQAAFETPPTVEDVGRVSDLFAGQFPSVQAINSFALSFSTDASGTPKHPDSTSSKLGFRRSSALNDRVLALRVQGMAYSHMPPYSNWDSFVGEFLPVWQRYCDELGVVGVSRIGVRFINRIPANDLEDIDEYLALAPRIPDAVSKYLIGYFLQLVMPIPELGPEFRAVVNSGIEPGSPGGRPHLLLDVDVFADRRFEASGPELLGALQNLRFHKNRIFEGSITDRVREIIK